MIPVAAVPIAGTERRHTWPDSEPTGPVHPDDVIRMTAWLRPRESRRSGPEDALTRDARALALSALAPGDRRYADRAALREGDPDAADLERFERYCQAHGIATEARHWRSVGISGPLGALIEAFTAEVRTHSYEGHRFRHRSGALHVPPDLRGIVRAVFGLHEWPRSARHRRIAMPATTSRVPLSAAEVAERYAFPDADGSGQTIGIIQFGGSFKADDFTKCLQGQGLAVPSVLTKRVDDAVATHALEGEFDEELALDVQIAGQLAPGATLVLYAAPHTERGLLDAIRTALFDEVHRPQILSISFGWPEFLWTPVALALLDDLFAAAALLGVSVFCASGDDGVGADYAGGPHVLAPASSPFVHACGGTHINGAGASAETAWEHSGGGFSAHHPVPVWQEVAREEAAAKHARAGRGVPDVSAQVEPGYTVVLDGVTHWAGGTSAVAPMWAALTARINQRLGTSAGFYAPLLYARRESGLFRDVTGGSNGLYDAHPGWSACTGLGVPNGDAILAALSA